MFQIKMRSPLTPRPLITPPINTPPQYAGNSRRYNHPPTWPWTYAARNMNCTSWELLHQLTHSVQCYH